MLYSVFWINLVVCFVPNCSDKVYEFAATQIHTSDSLIHWRLRLGRILVFRASPHTKLNHDFSQKLWLKVK